MNWDAFRHRGDVLREVVDEANRRLDGTLPTEVPGVAETFTDESALVGALLLRWHTRLSGHIERAVMERPTELEPAVLAAWRGAATELAGVRAILDAQAAYPATREIAESLERARRKDAVLMAAMAGLAHPFEPAAVRVGERLEAQARLGWDPVAVPPHKGAEPDRPETLLGRLKAHLVA